MAPWSQCPRKTRHAHRNTPSMEPVTPSPTRAETTRWEKCVQMLQLEQTNARFGCRIFFWQDVFYTEAEMARRRLSSASSAATYWTPTPEWVRSLILRTKPSHSNYQTGSEWSCVLDHRVSSCKVSLEGQGSFNGTFKHFFGRCYSSNPLS